MIQNEMFDCSICGEAFIGYGNNPQPYNGLSADDRCCDFCNEQYVTPSRMIEIDSGIKNELV